MKHNTLRLSDDALRIAHEAASQMVDLRQNWFMYRPGTIALQVFTSDPTPQVLPAQPAMLSRAKLLMVTRTFVHPSATCELNLPSVTGEPARKKTSVCDCRYVSEGAHVLLLKFGEALDPREILGPNAVSVGGIPEARAPELHPEAKPATPAAQAPEPSVERSLVFMPDSSEWQLAEDAVWEVSEDVTRVEYLGALMDSLRKKRFDVVFVEIDTDSLDPSDALARIRTAGHNGRVVFLTFDSEIEIPADTSRALRPLQAEALSEALAA